MYPIFIMLNRPKQQYHSSWNVNFFQTKSDYLKASSNLTTIVRFYR
jgi:hypothetical protein